MRFQFSLCNLIWLGTCALALGFSATCFAQNDIANKPLVTLAGADSRIDRPGYQLITSRRDWTNLWLRHTGRPVEKEYDDFYNPAGVPEINFEKCMVIAVFAGKTENITAIEASTYVENADQIRLRFRERGYQTAGANGGAVKSTPYGLFVVSRSSKLLILEQNVQDIKGAPPVWKEVARFFNAVIPCNGPTML